MICVGIYAVLIQNLSFSDNHHQQHLGRYGLYGFAGIYAV